ncbi:MAG: hypothetical protein IIU73_05260 [Selenomonadales bacterium]|nr:hypothetical protein [Selenomonadales bacterium]
MPNRIIKESLFESEKIAQLSDFEFRLWVGLITQADDAGRGDARPAIIKGRVFALRERVALKDIDVSLHALAAYGCVILYEIGGRPYYAFPNWTEHQRVRDSKPKYPAPPDDLFAASRSNSPQVAASCRLNTIQSESNTNPNTKRTAFSPPTLADVEAYCKERRNSVDPQRFFDYYSAGGWKDKDGKPVKNWKQKMISVWEKKEDKHETGQRDYTAAPDGMVLIV